MDCANQFWSKNEYICVLKTTSESGVITIISLVRENKQQQKILNNDSLLRANWRKISAEILPTSYLLLYKCWSDGLTDWLIKIALSWAITTQQMQILPLFHSLSIMCQGVGTRSTLQWHHRSPALEMSTQSSHRGNWSLSTLFNLCSLFQLCRDANRKWNALSNCSMWLKTPFLFLLISSLYMK